MQQHTSCCSHNLLWPQACQHLLAHYHLQWPGSQVPHLLGQLSAGLLSLLQAVLVPAAQPQGRVIDQYCL